MKQIGKTISFVRHRAELAYPEGKEFFKSGLFGAALNGAVAAAARSCDPVVRVGAAAVADDKLILGWNHIPADFVPPGRFWTTPSERRLFVTHAEVAVCSQILPYECSWLVTTRKPCPQCLISIAAAQVESIFYLAEADYADSERVAKAYGLRLHSLPQSTTIWSMPAQTTKTEWEFLTETLELLRTHGNVTLPFVTAQFQPFSSKDRPDLVFIRRGKNSEAVFVELKLAASTSSAENLVRSITEHAEFARSDSEIPLKFIFATASSIPQYVKDQLKSVANITAIDNVTTPTQLANQILDCSVQ